MTLSDMGGPGMRVVLARRRPSARAPGEFPAVHAYRVPDDPRLEPIWRAACGVTLAAVEAEYTSRFSGAPCTACLMMAFGQQQSGPAPVGAWERAERGTRPAIQPVTAHGRYAAALTGERQIHLVAPHAPRGQLDGSAVVHALCGHLGWGPYQSPPADWSICDECRQAEGERRLS